ncbi:Hint domain-containing protein [Dinoroseobacter sp. S375]|uniref:Hint domain-containing protein n=1 Tax=Dinoroseobacter sp. S375 TaxID=3415136 RepID=UPI003C7C7793
MPKKSKSLATQDDASDHSYSSVGYPNDAYYLPEGTDLKVMDLKLVDQDGDGDIGPGDTINGSKVTASYLGDAVGVDFGDGEQVVEGVTFYLSDGSQIFMATDGTQLEDGEATGSKWVNSSTDVPVSSITAPCFVAGTLIATPEGEVPVEELRAGDLVLTRDHGAQRLLWVGQLTLPGDGAAAPIRFAPEALGGTRPLFVSPQHRMLLQDGRLDLLLAEEEVLAAACHLVNGVSVAPAPRMQVTYVHLLFARHEIVFAEGVPSESFHPGEEGMRAFGPARTESAFETFPDLAAFIAGYGPCARRVLRAHEAVVAGRLVIGADRAAQAAPLAA